MLDATDFETSMVRLQRSKLCQVRMAAIKTAGKLKEYLAMCRVFEQPTGAILTDYQFC